MTRHFAALLALLSSLSVAHAPIAAQAQDYPTKPIRLITPAAQGGTTDLLARLCGAKLSEIFGQQVIVDNRASASGVIAGDMTAKAAPDGYTLLISPQTSTSVATTLYPKLPYDVLKDFAIITVVGSSPQLLVLVRDGRDSAEIAFAVADAHQHKGIGSALTAELLGDARAAGIRQITALTSSSMPMVTKKSPSSTSRNGLMWSSTW